MDLNKDIRFIAEWEPVESVLIALPDETTDWDYILPEAQAQYATLTKAITSEKTNVVVLCRDADRAYEILKDCDARYLTFITADYNDTWTRDYGPISVIRHDRLRALDFGFNGWGLKFAADKDNLINLFLKSKHILQAEVYKNQRDFILEGGSVETDGEGTVLTTTKCLCSENRNGGLSKEQAVEQLSRRLGAVHVLMIDYGELEGDDTDSHIDTLARLAPGNTIIFTGCRNIDDSHFEPLLKMRAQLTMFRNKEGNPFNLVEIPLPDPIYDENGDRLPATYANYLVANGVIFVPSYGQPMNDELAANTLRIAFPEHKIVKVDCRTLIRQHGSLHCATMQIPKGLLTPVIYDK